MRRGLKDGEIEQLRSRASYRVSVAAFRIGVPALCACAIGFALQHTVVPKPIVAVLVVAGAAAAVVSLLVYFCAATYLGISMSLRHRSVYNPRAQWQFTKVFTADLVRSLRRGHPAGDRVT